MDGGRPVPRRDVGRTLFAAFCAAAMTLGWLGGTAAALSCAERDPDGARRRGAVIVGGTIEAESLAGVRVAVERVYAGTAERTITVLPGEANQRRVATTWTFYLVRSPIAYHTSDCDGSHPNPPTSRELSVLGDGYPPLADDVVAGSTLNGLLLVGAAVWLARAAGQGQVARSLAVMAAGVGAGSLLAALLLGPAFPMRGALIGGEWWVAMFAFTAVAIGGTAAMLLRRPQAIIVAGFAPVLAILTLIAVKAARWPAAPAVGDGFAVIPLGVGLAGAAVAAGVSVASGVTARAAAVLAILAVLALSLIGVYVLTLFFGR